MSWFSLNKDLAERKRIALEACIDTLKKHPAGLELCRQLVELVELSGGQQKPEVAMIYASITEQIRAMAEKAYPHIRKNR